MFGYRSRSMPLLQQPNCVTPLAFRSLSPRGRPERRRTGARHFYIDGARTAIIGADAYPNPHHSPQRLILCGPGGIHYKMTRSSSTAELSRCGVFRSTEDLRDSRDSSRTRAASCEDMCRATCSPSSPSCAWDSRLSESGVSLNDSRTDLGSSCAGLEDMDGASQCSFGSSLAFHEMTADSELDRADSDYVSAPSSTCEHWQGVGKKKARHDSGSREKFLSELSTSGSGRSSPTEDGKEFYHSTPTKRRSPVLSIFPADEEDLHFPSKPYSPSYPSTDPPPLPLTSPPHSPLPQSDDDPYVQRFTEIMDDFNTSSPSGSTTHHNSRLQLFPFAPEDLEPEEESEEHNKQSLISCMPALSQATIASTTSINRTVVTNHSVETVDEGISSSINPCLQSQPYQRQQPSSASSGHQNSTGMSVKDRVRLIEQGPDPSFSRSADIDHDLNAVSGPHAARRPHYAGTNEIEQDRETLKSEGGIDGGVGGSSSFSSPSPPSTFRPQFEHPLHTSARNTTNATPGAGSSNTGDDCTEEEGPCLDEVVTSLLANSREGRVRAGDDKSEEGEEEAATRQEEYGTHCRVTQTAGTGRLLNKSGEGEDGVTTYFSYNQLPLVIPADVARVRDVDSTVGAGVNTTTTTTTTTIASSSKNPLPQSPNRDSVNETSLTLTSNQDTNLGEGRPDIAGGIFTARQHSSQTAASAPHTAKTNDTQNDSVSCLLPTEFTAACSANESSVADKGVLQECLSSQQPQSDMPGEQNATPTVSIREISRRHTHHVERTKVKEMVKTERTVVRHAPSGSAEVGDHCNNVGSVTDSTEKRTIVRKEEKEATTTITTTTSALPRKQQPQSAECRAQDASQSHLPAGQMVAGHSAAATNTVRDVRAELKIQQTSPSNLGRDNGLDSLMNDNCGQTSGSCTALNSLQQQMSAFLVEDDASSSEAQQDPSGHLFRYNHHHPESFPPSKEINGEHSAEGDSQKVRGLSSVSITLCRDSSQQRGDLGIPTSYTVNGQTSDQRSGSFPGHSLLAEDSKYVDTAVDESNILSASFDDILNFDDITDKSDSAVPEIKLWNADDFMATLSSTNLGGRKAELLTSSQHVPTAIHTSPESFDNSGTADNCKLASSLHSISRNPDRSVVSGEMAVSILKGSKVRKTRKGIDSVRATESDPTDYLHSKQLTSLKHSKKSPWVVETVDQFQNILNDFVNQDSIMQKSIVHDMMNIDTEHRDDESELEKQMEVCEDLYRSFTREFLEKRQNHVCPIIEDNMPVFRFKRFLRKKHNSKLKGHKTFRIRHHLDRLAECSLVPEGAPLSASEPCLAKSRLSVHHPHHRVSSSRPRGRLVSDVFTDDFDITRSTDSAYSSLCSSLSPHVSHLDSGFHSMTSSRADVSSVATDLSLEGDILTSPCDVYEHLDLSDVGIDEALLDRLRACHYKAGGPCVKG